MTHRTYLAAFKKEEKSYKLHLYWKASYLVAFCCLTIFSEVMRCRNTQLKTQCWNSEQKSRTSYMAHVWALDTEMAKASYNRKFKPEKFKLILSLINFNSI